MSEPTSRGLPQPDSLYGSPTDTELLAAVEHFLRNDMEGLSQLSAYHARVAANVIATVIRQLEAGDAPRRMMAEAYGRLGAKDEQSLADAVHSGALDGRTSELRAALEVVVRSRLQVANPRYLEENPPS